MNRLFSSCLALLGTVILLAGCQGSGGKQSANDKVQAYTPIPADWDKGFRMGPQQEGEGLYITEYLNLEHKTPVNTDSHRILACKVRGKRFYALREYTTDQDWNRFLEVHVPENGEPEQVIELISEQWELSDGFIESFDVTEEGYVFLIKADYVMDEKGRKHPSNLQLVYVDNQGAFLSRTDLTTILPQEQLERILEGSGYFYRDAEGYLYLTTASNTLLLVFDGDGNPVTQYDCSGSNPHRIQNWIQDPVRDDSGRLIFPVWLGEEGTMRLLGREGNTLKELVSLSEIITDNWCGMYGCYMYYLSNDIGASSLICWNVETGLREKMLELSSLGILSSDNIRLLSEKKDKLYLRIYTDQEDYMVTLSEQAPEYTDPITVAAVHTSYGGKYLSSTIARMKRKSPLYTYILEMDQENAEAYRTRVIADLMAGGGPDILCVSLEDMDTLADFGALIPIDQLVSKETLEALLPGIIQEGTRDGKLMGIAVEAEAYSLITSKNTWAGESWTLEDILVLAEKKEGLEGILTYGIVGMSDHDVLYNLVGRNLEDTRFLDLENGVSRFEQENFMRVLEVVQRFSGAGDSSEEGTERVKEGAFLAEELFVTDPSVFFREYAHFGGECNTVGYPRESGAGNFIRGRDLLVVNANTKNLQAVSDILEYLLSFENQSVLASLMGGWGSLSVRTDMADRSVQYNENLSSFVWKTPDVQIMLESRADGNTFMDEYNAFLQSCVPIKDRSPIFDLVWEEASAFFSGDKDALTVTRAIDNRVQLYLDERN